MPAPRPLSAPAMVEPVEHLWPLVAIVGPTASGKSALGLTLAEKTGGEILNYDSVQIYRGFTIGSGSVPREAQRGIPHHLLGFLDPGKVFTAGDYRREALRVLSAVRERGRLPILIGGTGLYLRSLLEGLFEGPLRSDTLRARLRQMDARHHPSFLHRMLIRLDAASAARIHPGDKQKLIRGIEVCLLAGQPLSEMLRKGRTGLEGFQVLKLGLDPPRPELHARINRRVECMYEAGLLEEVRTVLARTDCARLKPLEALGYPQACAALRGDLSVGDAIRQTQAATRRYAKRQMTWFRREEEVTWFRGFGDDLGVQRQVVDWVGSRLSLASLAGFHEPTDNEPRT